MTTLWLWYRGVMTVPKKIILIIPRHLYIRDSALLRIMMESTKIKEPLWSMCRIGWNPTSNSNLKKWSLSGISWAALNPQRIFPLKTGTYIRLLHSMRRHLNISMFQVFSWTQLMDRCQMQAMSLTNKFLFKLTLVPKNYKIINRKSKVACLQPL